MLEKFDAADESGDLCQYGAGIREALLWVDETSSDDAEEEDDDDAGE